MAVQQRKTVRYAGKTVGEIRLHNGSKSFVWYQSLLRFYGDSGGFAIGEGLLSQIPVEVETFIVCPPDRDESYLYKRQDFETGDKLHIYDERFNETPPEPQYVAPLEDARKTLTLDE